MIVAEWERRDRSRASSDSIQFVSITDNQSPMAIDVGRGHQ
jgi:hypothetical protein